MGPFYCPLDKKVYLDTSFFQEMERRFKAGGDFAYAYVIAHEVGHHVQTLLGVSAKVNEARRRGQNVQGDGGLLVRQELQADCFAGAWVANAAQQRDANGVAYLQPPTEAEIRDALNAAEVVGDDHIQQSSGGFVNPETWTHGSSEQRQRWFATGYQNGVSACDTFAVSGDRL